MSTSSHSDRPCSFWALFSETFQKISTAAQPCWKTLARLLLSLAGVQELAAPPRLPVPLRHSASELQNVPGTERLLPEHCGHVAGKTASDSLSSGLRGVSSSSSPPCTAIASLIIVPQSQTRMPLFGKFGNVWSRRCSWRFFCISNHSLKSATRKTRKKVSWQLRFDPSLI